MAAGTMKVVDWLANAARECEDGSVGLRQPPRRKQRSKKKSTSNAPQNVKISSAQMVQLAEAVSKSSINVPFHILNTLDSVIDGRKHCAKFYAAIRSKSTTLEAIQNESPKHFINVLKDTRSILAKRCRDAPPQVKKLIHGLPETNNSEDPALSNALRLLQIDEPSSNPLGNAPERNN